ncbi:hypothetical protein J14TS5_24560 [Paenibacillus lautus]|uniref:hypothetical protein n=1 Tax=Paenibacillus lautus TaxID=1401 RepID=UPI001B2EF20D|nr:hypothetical protein [Paenibacillus lautus]GIO97370.1 hypothetical protein J14TS5_24560 [Paenibacillus lautus]
MESNLHKKIHNKVKKWSKGFADKERPYMYEESYTIIENFLKSHKEKKDFIYLALHAILFPHGIVRIF